MVIRRQRNLPDSPQQFSESRITRQVRAQNNRVDKETDQILHVGVTASGNRHTDGDVELTAVSRKQCLEGRQQCHMQRHTSRLA